MSERAPPATNAWPTAEVGLTDAGLRVATLERPGPLVALRLTVGVGARHGERPGAAHMFEHLVFRTRSGAQARRSLERLGGQVGATTTREQISLDTVVLAQDVPRALDALGHICSAQPAASDLERERDVVLREIAHEEEERRRLWQLQAEALFGTRHPLARPILGTPTSVRELDESDVEWVRERFRTGNAALAAAGPIGLDELCDGAQGLLADRSGGRDEEPSQPPVPAGRRHEERRSRSMHLAVGWRFDGLDDPRLPALRLVESVLADGSGSRLYSRLRTQRRLAYRVSTVLIPYRDAGHLSVVTACDPHHVHQAELAVVGEVERLAARGPTWPEMVTARRQIEGSLARAFEVSRRLAGFAATQLLFDRLESIDAMVGRIAACEPQQVADAAASLLRDPGGHAVTTVGWSPGVEPSGRG